LFFCFGMNFERTWVHGDKNGKIFQANTDDASRRNI